MRYNSNKLLKFLKWLKNEKKGEIATILTVVTLGLMLIGTVVGTKLAERSTEQRTQARGFGDLKSKGLTGSELQKQDYPSCTLFDQEPNVGNCCATCITSKRPDLRQFFDSNGWAVCSDTQIVNNWCNGILGKAEPDPVKKAQCTNLKTGDCKTECTKDQNTCQSTGGTKPPGGNQGTPNGPSSPGGQNPQPPGGQIPPPGGDDNNGNTGQTTIGKYPSGPPKPNGVIVIKGKISASGDPAPADPPDLKSYKIKLKELISSPGAYKAVSDDLTLGTATSTSQNPSAPYTKSAIYSFGTKSTTGEDYMVIYITQAVNPATTFNPSFTIANGTTNADKTYPIVSDDDEDKQLRLCFPYGLAKDGQTPAPTAIPDPTDANGVLKTIVSYCESKNYVNNIALEYNKPTAPDALTPPTEAVENGYYLFPVDFTDATGTFNNNTVESLTVDQMKVNGTDANIMSSLKLINSSDVNNYVTNSQTVDGKSYKWNTFIYKTKPGIAVDTSKSAKPVFKISMKINGAVTATDITPDDNTGNGSIYIVPCFPFFVDKNTSQVVPPNSADEIKAVLDKCTASPRTLYLDSSTNTTPSTLPLEVTIRIIENESTQTLPTGKSFVLDVFKYKPATEIVNTYTYQNSDFVAQISDAQFPGQKVQVKTQNISLPIEKSFLDLATNSNDVLYALKLNLNPRDLWCGAIHGTLNESSKNITKADIDDYIARYKTTPGATHKISYRFNVDCEIGHTQEENLAIQGSSNEAFRAAMEKWVNGELGVLQMSSFISQLTRTPGLQMAFCDPTKGECNIL